jgi:uncharacterized protein YqfB (UPF0267 family)
MSEIVWDDETQAYVKAEDLKLRKLKQEIINELLTQLTQNYVIEFQVDLKTGQAKGNIKKKA